jgi:PncC family amidohydrolase
MGRMKAALLVRKLKAAALKAVAAESCSGGLLGAEISKVPGASEVFWGAFVTDTTDAKQTMLAVPRGTLERFGAVSAQTAQAMLESALEKSQADLGVSITGLAGPRTDGSDNPVGVVWIGAGTRGAAPLVTRFHFTGTRAAIRRKTVKTALEMLEKLADAANQR